MGKVTVTSLTSATLEGPFMLDSKQLEELDKLLGEEKARLEAYRNQLVEDAVNEEFAKYQASRKEARYTRTFREDEKELKEQWDLRQRAKEEQDEKDDRERAVSYANRLYKPASLEVTVFAPSGKRFSAETFAEINRAPGMHEHHAKRCLIRLEAARVTCKVDIDRDFVSGSEAEIEVSPASVEASQELFVRLRRFFERSQSHRVIRFLHSAPPLHWLVFGLYFFVGVQVAGRRIEPPHPARLEAAKLLSDGYKQTDQAKAVELLLRLQAEPGPPAQTSIADWFLPWLAVLFAISVAMHFWPRVEIGVGRGDDRIVRWRWWLKFMYATIPLAIFAGTVKPYLGAVLKKALLP